MTLRRLANGWSSMAVSIVANLAPWLAPLPTAWLVYERTMRHLAWPQWVAIVAGATLELLGVAILATALELYNYNRNKRKSDPLAPFWLGAVLVGLYLATALLLTVVLDIAPAAALFAPALFPILSVASFALLALRADHERRLSDIAAGKAEAKAARDARRSAKANTATAKANDDPQPARYVCTVAGCEFASRTQNGLNAHMRSHRTKGGQG